MRFEIANAAEAVRAIEYFNAFHDGFVRELRVTSHDSFPERGVHDFAGPPDLTLVFAHYNYERDTRPADQLVRASFRGVTDLQADLAGRSTESAITFVAIEPGARNLQNADEPCLVASMVVSRLGTDQAWTAVEAIRFSFAQAVIEEL